MKLTTRNAEIIVAIVLALCSIALMVKSAQNRIDWTVEDNMGAGFMPFWLSAGMLICTIISIVKWITKNHLNQLTISLLLTLKQTNMFMSQSYH